MPTIKNEGELKSIMEQKASEALERVAKRVIDIFKKDYILKYVYTDNPKQYTATFDFLNAWNWTPLKKEITKISKEMWYNPDLMFHSDISDGKYQHGSKYGSPPLAIKELMEILDKTGRSSSLFLSNGVNRKGAYFKEFENDMFGGGMLEKIITEEFSKVGFVKI